MVQTIYCQKFIEKNSTHLRFKELRHFSLPRSPFEGTRSLWGGSNTIPLKTTAFEGKVIWDNGRIWVSSYIPNGMKG